MKQRDILKHTVIMRDNNPDDKGTVIEVGYDGFAVRWANGSTQWLDYTYAALHIDLWYPRGGL